MPAESQADAARLTWVAEAADEIAQCSLLFTLTLIVPLGLKRESYDKPYLKPYFVERVRVLSCFIKDLDIFCESRLMAGLRRRDLVA